MKILSALALLLCTTLIISAQELEYSSVQIGNQVWMNKNLDLTQYRNGDPIPHIQDPVEWSKATTGAWCYYANDEVIGSVCGKLYNGWAIMDPRGLAPKGWRITTQQDWTELFNYLIKEKGYSDLVTSEVWRWLAWGEVSKENPFFTDKDLLPFQNTSINSPVTHSFKFLDDSKRPRWKTEERTQPLRDFLMVGSGSNELGLNFLHCGSRDPKGEFANFHQALSYASFIYPATIFRKADGIFYWTDPTFRKTTTLNSFGANVKPGFVTTSISLSSPALNLNTSSYGFENAKFSKTKLKDEAGLGGNAEGYSIRCIRGDQWIDKTGEN